jgi:hypothetical protein
MKLGSKPSKQPAREPVDPLERARQEAIDVRDISRDDARRLRDYDADEEVSTARHDIPPQLVIHNHVHQDSIPDSERETALPELPKKGPWRWLALLVGTVVAAGLTWLSGRVGAK